MLIYYSQSNPEEIMRLHPIVAAIAVLMAGAACSEGSQAPHDKAWATSLSRVRTDRVVVPAGNGSTTVFNRPALRDADGRYVHFHGTNLSGSIKFPPTEKFPSLGIETSYVGKPFPLADADKHFRQLQRLGFNSVRFLISWEAIQPIARDKYDEDYVDYVEELIARARAYGIYVLLDMHQDIFSRHLFSYYNKHPVDPTGTLYPRGSLEAQVLSLVPPYDNWVRGDGAPRWVVEACLPEKRLDSPAWGVPRILYNMGPEELLSIASLIGKFMGGSGDGLDIPEWVDAFFMALPDPADLPEEFQPYDVRQSGDFLPFTFWGINGALSVDCQRCFAALFAGDKVTPDYMIDGVNVKDYLQQAYADAWVKIAQRAKNYENVIGYDIMNEPIGAYITYAAVAVHFSVGESAVRGLLDTLLGEETGTQLYDLLTGLKLLPPDNSEETREIWGFSDVDTAGVIDLNIGFDAKYLQPFYERIGAAIQKEDENAIIWFETSSGLEMLLGQSSQWAVNMTQPQGIEQAVFAPHWYPDIYPFIGFNQPPRSFGPEEWRFRDFTKNIEHIISKSQYAFGNVPVVFGEFGTYFNYNSIEDSVDSDFAISGHILDAYYRAFEGLGGVSQMLWCVSPENTYDNGEGWNLEDFSVLDPDLNPRAWQAWLRPFARATSGKLVATHFYSPLHPYEPEKGKPLPYLEFYLEMESKESDAPTEIFVPELHYRDGFYLWLSDGYAYYDSARQILYWYATRDDPEAVHTLRLLPPRPDADVHDWDYFFDYHTVIDRSGGVK